MREFPRESLREALYLLAVLQSEVIDALVLDLARLQCFFAKLVRFSTGLAGGSLVNLKEDEDEEENSKGGPLVGGVRRRHRGIVEDL